MNKILELSRFLIDNIDFSSHCISQGYQTHESIVIMRRLIENDINQFYSVWQEKKSEQ